MGISQDDPDLNIDTLRVITFILIPYSLPETKDNQIVYSIKLQYYKQLRPYR